MKKKIITDEKKPAEELSEMLIFAAAQGKIPEEQAVKSINVLRGKEGLLTTKDTFPVLDANGNELNKQKKYRLKYGGIDRECKITSCSFGAGNIMDTYYQVYYDFANDGKMDTGMVCVNGRGGMFSGFTYQSQFTPID